MAAFGGVDRRAPALHHAALTLQWNHSAVHQPWFVTPWEARERALGLHLELHPLDFNVPIYPGIELGKPMPRLRSFKGYRVHFEECVYFDDGSTATLAIPPHHFQTIAASNLTSSRATTSTSFSAIVDGSTAEEPLSPTVLSPATCAPHCNNDNMKPVDYLMEQSCPEWNTCSTPAENPNQHWVPPVEALPSWWQTLRYNFRTTALAGQFEEGPVLYVLTWFIHGQRHLRCHAPRVLWLDQCWHRWLDDIRELWHDEIDQADTLALGVVRPDPPLAPNRYHACHLIIHQQTTGLSVGVFTSLFHGWQHNAFGQFAQAMPPLISFAQLVISLQLSRQCFQMTRACVIQLEGQNVVEGDPPFYLEDYTSVILHIDHPAFPPRREDFEDDRTSFLAAGAQLGQPHVAPIPVIDNAQAVHQNDIDGIQDEVHGQDDGEDDVGDADGSSSSSDEGREWYPITAFSPDYPVGEGWANWINYQRYRRNVARIIGLDIDQIMQIYHVRWPPINLQTAGRQAVLVEKQGDLPTGSTHQMILIDVEFHPHRPSTAVEFVRGAYTVPDAFTRQNLLSFLGLTPYCAMTQNRCLVWRNHVLIPLQDQRQIRPQHGDYVRIVVPPVPERLQHVPTRPAARCAQLGISVNRIVTYYDNHDVEDDLHNMPTAHPGGFVDDMSLQQLSLRSLPSQGPRQHHREDCLEERLDDFRRDGADQPTPNFVAGAPPMIGFEGDIFARWDQFVQPGPGNLEQLVQVRTWYNDHQRWPICEQARDVSLFEDVTMWRHDLLRAWNDRIDPTVDVDIIVVEPDPVDETDHVAAHLILLQRPFHDARTILVSVMDNYIWNGIPRRWAIINYARPTSRRRNVKSGAAAERSALMIAF